MELNEVSEEEVQQIVSFVVGAEKYGLNILNVREIIRVIDITPVPMAPTEILGVINLRGNVIPAIDFRTLFGLEHVDATEDTRTIVIEYEDVVIGVVVDAVSEVLTIAQNRFEPAPRNPNSDTANFINTVIVLEEDSLLLVVDIESLFEHNDALPESTEQK